MNLVLFLKHSYYIETTVVQKQNLLKNMNGQKAAWTVITAKTRLYSSFSNKNR